MKAGLSTGMIQRGKTGVAQYVFALIRAMLELPNRPELTLFVLEDDVGLFDFVGDRARIVRVSERHRPAVRNILWHQFTLPGLVQRLGLEVLHVPSYRRMLWTRRCPRVATIHDLAPFHVRGKYDPARMFYGRVVVRALARRQDEIIAISRNTAGDIERFFGLPAAQLNVVHNGIDHERFCPGDAASAQAEAAARWGLNRPFFLYVSRLEHPSKNHVRLIEAFGQFRRRAGVDWMLALGGSDWHGAEAIYGAAEHSSARESIRFLGFVPDAALPDLYRAAGAMVYPSLFEGFGFPPIEAMACACPVVSSTRGALAEVVGEAAGVVDPEDVAALAEALRRVATDGAWRGQLRAAGLRNARRFSWETNAREVVRLYTRARDREK